MSWSRGAWRICSHLARFAMGTQTLCTPDAQGSGSSGISSGVRLLP